MGKRSKRQTSLVTSALLTELELEAINEVRSTVSPISKSLTAALQSRSFAEDPDGIELRYGVMRWFTLLGAYAFQRDCGQASGPFPRIVWDDLSLISSNVELLSLSQTPQFALVHELIIKRSADSYTHDFVPSSSLERACAEISGCIAAYAAKDGLWSFIDHLMHGGQLRLAAVTALIESAAARSSELITPFDSLSMGAAWWLELANTAMQIASAVDIKSQDRFESALSQALAPWFSYPSDQLGVLESFFDMMQKIEVISSDLRDELFSFASKMNDGLFAGAGYRGA